MRLKSLRSKFILQVSLLVLVVSSVFLTFFIFEFKRTIQEELNNQGSLLVKYLAYAQETADNDRENVFLESISKEKDVFFVAIYNKEGHTIAQKGRGTEEGDLPAFVKGEVFNKEDVVIKTEGRGEQEKFYAFFYPIYNVSLEKALSQNLKREITGVAEVELSFNRAAQESKNIIILGSIITLLLIIFGLIVGFWLSGRIVKPIRELEEGARAISKGDLNYQLKIKTHDEVEQLADSFANMTKTLKESQTSLEEAKNILEVKVRARTVELKEVIVNREEMVQTRTAELQEKIRELEKFNKFTLGREFKMIELKKEIQDLKKKKDSQ